VTDVQFKSKRKHSALHPKGLTRFFLKTAIVSEIRVAPDEWIAEVVKLFNMEHKLISQLRYTKIEHEGQDIFLITMYGGKWKEAFVVARFFGDNLETYVELDLYPGEDTLKVAIGASIFTLPFYLLAFVHPLSMLSFGFALIIGVIALYYWRNVFVDRGEFVKLLNQDIFDVRPDVHWS
jgi:hypothetical protein